MSLSEVIREWLAEPITSRHHDLMTFLAQTHEQTERLMATIQEALDQIQGQIDETKESLRDALDRVASDVTDLQAEVQSGNTVTPEQLDPILSGLDSVKSSLDRLDPVPPEDTE